MRSLRRSPSARAAAGKPRDDLHKLRGAQEHSRPCLSSSPSARPYAQSASTSWKRATNPSLSLARARSKSRPFSRRPSRCRWSLLPPMSQRCPRKVLQRGRAKAEPGSTAFFCPRRGATRAPPPPSQGPARPRRHPQGAARQGSGRRAEGGPREVPASKARPSPEPRRRAPEGGPSPAGRGTQPQAPVLRHGVAPCSRARLLRQGRQVCRLPSPAR
mmetsp:Transcript_29899/g.84240  ORF Transcript_29899/g.84240 Transcript_29899/m.84240 type:complete len:216 (-) Transcript_29899:44-691(-)